MGDWILRTLGDLFTLQRGIDLPDRERSFGDVPIMGSFGITGWHNIAACKGPGVTVGRSGASIGAVNYVSGDYWPLNTCLYIKDFKGNCQRFVYYFLKNIDLARLNSGSAQPSLNRNFVHPVPASFPGRDEQDMIASVLTTIDDKIDLNRQMNETLEAMARAIFKDWFVDFGPTRAKMEGRTPYLAPEIWSLFPDRLDDQGKPEGWVMLPIPDAIEFKEGPGIRNWQYTNSDCGTRFINIRCIKDDDLDIGTANRVTDLEANNKYAHFKLRVWDIVVSTSGTLGRSAIVRKEHLPLILNTSVIRFRPIKDRSTVPYLYSFLKGAHFVDKLESMASGSVQKNFGPMHLRQMEILTPPLPLLQQHRIIVMPLLERIVGNRSENDTLSAIRDFLLPKLMSGEIRTKEVNEKLERELERFL